MSDTSQGPGWWLASDGRWYPPESHPNAVLPPPPPAPPRKATSAGFQPLKSSIAQWTQGAMWVVAIAQGIQALFAWRYWQAFSNWYDHDKGTLSAVVSAEDQYNAVVTINWMVWIAGFIVLVVWLANVHTTTTSLLPRGQSREYTRNWSIWVWFIPVVNILGTPQVIAECQKIAFAPRNRTKVSESWKTTPVKNELVWWWLLVVAGMITSGVGGRTMNGEFVSTRDYLTGVTAMIIGSMLTALGVLVGAAFITEMNKELTSPTS